eukprot:6298718-Alexandrium_andersonii.AAC.1
MCGSVLFQTNRGLVSGVAVLAKVGYSAVRPGSLDREHECPGRGSAAVADAPGFPPLLFVSSHTGMSIVRGSFNMKPHIRAKLGMFRRLGMALTVHTGDACFTAASACKLDYWFVGNGLSRA